MSKTTLLEGIRNFVSILEELNAKYCLIGGLAVVIRAYERTTKDIDFAILVSDDSEAEEIVKSVREHDYEIFSLLEKKNKELISTVRLQSNTTNIVVDLLFNSCGIEKEIISNATVVEVLNSVYCKVATIPSLIAMKVLSSNNDSRLQDIVDLQHLLKEASKQELVEAEKLLELIHKRHYNAEQDLIAKYQDFKIRFLKT